MLSNFILKDEFESAELNQGFNLFNFNVYEILVVFLVDKYRSNVNAESR